MKTFGKTIKGMMITAVGGLRVIYYRYVEGDEIYMLLAYGKGEKDDLSTKELKIIQRLVQKEVQ